MTDKIDYLQEEKYNNQGCLMKIVEFNKSNSIVVEFQDKYKTRLHSTYANFKSGSIKNPYYPSVYGVGIIGTKYPRSINCRNIKEYEAWRHILRRCLDNKLKSRQPTYNGVIYCDEWLNYEKFYEWLHSQENFNKWYEGDRWAIDKDIFVKRSKRYSPDTCCLVPQNVNCLFLKREAERGNLPIGVRANNNYFEANCANPFTGKKEYIGTYSTISTAFLAYKKYKERLIKQIAEIEYKAGNITKKCYEAMLNYVVEIDD